MPNVGRPSKGCKNCRDRKLKCDQRRPSCSQCIRAGKRCHGYRDMFSMMFKNESDVVAKKAEKRYEELAKQKASTPKRKGSQTRDSESSEIYTSRDQWSSTGDSSTQLVPWTRSQTRESLELGLMPSIEEQAQGFFIANYVAPPGIVPRGQFEWVIELLRRPNVEEVLRSSVNAASLAGFANATKNPTIMQKAQAAYISALRMTNSALSTKRTAVKNSTLISVLLLGVYENMVFQDMRSIQACAKHAYGACALINLRGPEQFKESIARRIYHQSYGFALLVALETGTPVYKGLHELYVSLRPTADYKVAGQQWTTRITEFMHNVINLNGNKMSDPVTILTTASKLDHDLDEVKSLMPSIWHYETFQLEYPSVHHYGNVYSVYADPWVAQMWNNLRSCRMNLHKTVQENIRKGCEDYDPPLFTKEQASSQQEATEQVMRGIVAEVIASVPQITGMIPFPTELEVKSAGSPITSLKRRPLHPPGTFLDPVKSTGLVYLICPLFAAGASDFATYEMQQWTIKMLHFIALRIGTMQAVVFAEELKRVQRAGKRIDV